ncbi:carbamoyl phosphate synthase small subunit [Furfurilactobacillus milii]|uniref:Carbamoyl phosphate synthase small chain n=1 Tax=Furfurilactobacillus milii TaxID=2888272 RepID=A0A6N9I530_9LACO|nr:carbamoyl phosphate synthase small subunit [Furfurilactobacillus milii]MYV17794.1 carbamoyl phosphate synthase small subunit [Furfurilactobacillus milii]
MTTNKRALVLENGSVYWGEGFGADRDAMGELVFNTGMTGYQESLTDLSYRGQLLTFTYPLIGNYGINAVDFESLKPAASAVIVHEVATQPSNWRATQSLPEWAQTMGLPGLTGVDTRTLTKEIRSLGTVRAALVDAPADDIFEKLKSFEQPDLVEQATTKSVYVAPNTGLNVALIDFGMKNSILRALAKRQINVTVFPADTDAETILNTHPDGVLLSNGPGDPRTMTSCLKQIRTLETRVPLMGICLGHQLFALANGAETFKMHEGHRGFNHAVKNLKTGHLAFTSQNHGYAVDAASVTGTSLVVTHEEVNDHTVEGLRLTGQSAFSVQFHPDAAPGPHDAEDLFDHFVDLMTQKGAPQHA